MASIYHDCSVRQGFNFEKDAQVLVGHINSLKIGETELLSDIGLTDPENIQGDEIKVFGVVQALGWEGGYADPIEFECQISTENKKTLATMVHQTLSNTSALFSFTIYDYDPEAKKYYKCLHTDGQELECLIMKSGGELRMAVDSDQAEEVVSPKNYTFRLAAMPEDKEMAIHMAVSVSDKFVKKFGVDVSA